MNRAEVKVNPNIVAGIFLVYFKFTTVLFDFSIFYFFLFIYFFNKIGLKFIFRCEVSVTIFTGNVVVRNVLYEQCSVNIVIY